MQKDGIESWNQLFPEAQIRQSDLSQPTDTFLTEKLVAYLKSFGYKVEPPSLGQENKWTSREYRAFLIKLSRQIDHILKKIHKTYSFKYLDLIQPTPKKTTHTLNTLLNYLYYFNMYKTDVFQMANEKIKEHEELKQRFDELQTNLNQGTKHIQKVTEELQYYVDELPSKISELKETKTKYEEQNEKLKLLEASNKELDEKLAESLEEMRSLKKKIVPNSQAENLKAEIMKVKTIIAKNEEELATIGDDIKTCYEGLQEQEKVKKIIENEELNLPENLISDFKENTRKLNEAKTENASLLNEKKEAEKIVAQQENLYIATVEKVKAKGMEIESLNGHHLQLEQMEENLKLKQAEHVKINEEVQQLRCQLEEQKDTADMLSKFAAELLLK